MYDKPQFEFPEAVRELAERNVEQARSAYNQFIDMARKVQETLTASNTVKKVEAQPTKRYCRLRITSTGVTTGCVFKEATAVLSDPKNAPA